MRVISRKEFLKAGAALPLALQTLGLRFTQRQDKLDGGVNTALHTRGVGGERLFHQGLTVSQLAFARALAPADAGVC